MQYYDLADNRKLGVCIFEIESIPSISTYGNDGNQNCEKLANEFVQLLTETHKLVSGNTCIELLWITEKTGNQIFLSRIRIFVILRKIAVNKDEIEYELSHLSKSLKSSFSALQYGIRDQEDVDHNLSILLENVDANCVYSAVKSEKCVANSGSLYPYYYGDILPLQNNNNFNAIVSTMSQQENCCLSFQLFPTTFTNEEIYLINEMTGELGRIVSGLNLYGETYRDAQAAEPLKVYSYYNEHRNSPIFLYNILAFGERACCASIVTKVVSLMQGGKEKITATDPICLDLTSERIDLKKHFPHYVWNINNRLLYHYRNKKLQRAVPIAQNMYRLPYILTAEEAASFFRLPLYEKTMTALRTNQVMQAQEQFTNAVVNENNIQIGKLITNDSSNIIIGCSEKAFTKHALVVGTPGSGKTTFSVNILLQFARRGIPFLAIEPTKSEYRAMIEAIPDLQIFTPGNNAVSPYIINPFIPPKGIRIEQYIPSLASAFKAAFSMASPLDMIFLKAIRNCYIQYGWKDYSMLGDPDVKLFGLYEFILVFKKLLSNTNYSSEVRGNLESAGLLRLSNLIEQNSNIYDTIHTVPIEDLLTAPTVLELNSIDNAEQKSLIMALLLINICIYTKHNQIGDGQLKNVILIDEAHVLLGGNVSNVEGSADSQGATIKALQDMIAEIRSYGTSIIIADQSPTKVSREVVANTDIKVSFRLVQSMEKDLIADSTNMNDEARDNLSKLHPGEAYIYYSQLETPQMVLTEDIREKEGILLSVSDQEVSKKSIYWNNHLELLKPYAECEYCKYCKNTCDFKVRSNAEFIANQAFNRYRKEINSIEDYRKCIYHLPVLMKDDFAMHLDLGVEKLQICSRIKLIRKITMEMPFELQECDKKKILENFPKCK